MQSQPLVLKLVLTGKQWKKYRKLISCINKTNKFYFLWIYLTIFNFNLPTYLFAINSQK